MTQSKTIERLAAFALMFTVFAAGYVCGATHTAVAEAQLQNLGSQALQGAAAAASGTSIGQMGTNLVEMQQHVSGLQKNLDALQKVKAALGG